MDSIDFSTDLTALPTDHNARLLSESPPIGRSSLPDIPSSDFSVHDLPTGDRSQSQAVNDGHEEGEAEEGPRGEGDERGEGEEGGEDEEAQIRRARKAARTREEKLQNDLFLLKKLDGAFSLYTDALRTTQSSTERLKARLKDTNALLDVYIGMLDRSDAVTKLILDEKWQGASVDEETLMDQVREREAAERREAEARELEAELARLRLEEERLAREEEERLAREEEERLAREEEERRQAEREKALEKKKVVGRGASRTADPSSSGVRGVRGTRASMRARGVATGIARGTTTGIPRPSSSASSRTSAIPSRGRGRA